MSNYDELEHLRNLVTLRKMEHENQIEDFCRKLQSNLAKYLGIHFDRLKFASGFETTREGKINALEKKLKYDQGAYHIYLGFGIEDMVVVIPIRFEIGHDKKTLRVIVGRSKTESILISEDCSPLSSHIHSLIKNFFESCDELPTVVEV